MCSLNAVACASTESSFVCVQDFADYAKQVLPKSVKDYYYSGSCDQVTLRNNEHAFNRLRIRPRCLVDASRQDMRTTILGKEVRVPLGVSPSALQKMAHAEGEIGNARAVGAVGGIYILSTLSTTSLEDVRKGAPNTRLWFQLYVYKDRNLMENVVRRAEKAGYEALVLTVDANVFGIRYADERNQFDLPPHLKLGNFSSDTKDETLRTDTSSGGSGLRNHVDMLFDSTISWDDVNWLRCITSLPVVVKGVLTAEDAKLAIKYGAEAIMVSNHGGRQLDTSPASIEALPEIVKAVGDEIEVYLDGGIRYGTDIFKALALGAKMVFIGRPALWGLAHSGEAGVKKVLDILIKEFKTVMGLSGCQEIADIKKTMVVHESYYSKF